MSDFWGTVNAQLNRIEQEKPDTFEKVAAILEPIIDQGAIYGGAGSHDPQPWEDPNGCRYSEDTPEMATAYAPRRAFFAGSGGDRSLYSALRIAGWAARGGDVHYFYVAQHPTTGALLTYIEGDVLPGDAR